MEREPSDWHVRKSRQRLSLTGTGLWSDGTSATVLVSEMSYDGCQIWSDHDLTVGETIALTLRGKGTIEAQIRWADGSKAGLRFLIGQSAVDARRARLGI